MPISNSCKDRLYSFKFAQAEDMLHDEPDATDPEKQLITSLSNMFGNPGWFNGDMCVLICHALVPILGMEWFGSGEDSSDKHAPAAKEAT